MIFDALEWQIQNAGLLVPGETLFRHFMPAEVAIGAFTRAPLDGIKIEPGMPNWYRGEIQLITRHTDPVEGERLAMQLGEACKIVSLTHFPQITAYVGGHVTMCFPLTLPIRFPRLQGNGYEFAQAFNVAFGYQQMA